MGTFSEAGGVGLRFAVTFSDIASGPTSYLPE